MDVNGVQCNPYRTKPLTFVFLAKKRRTALCQCLKRLPSMFLGATSGSRTTRAMHLVGLVPLREMSVYGGLLVMQTVPL